MAATASEAFMLELVAQGGCEWIKSELYHKKEAARQKEREKNNPMKECVLKYDHFENIHRLGKGAKVTIEGAPNVRQVTGYLVFGTGQPTKEGFEGALKYLLNEETGAKSVMWTNMRQEPVVYMNGQSFTPRLADAMNENMEFPDMSGEDIEWLQDSFVKVIFGRIEESLANRRMKKEDAGKVKYYRDTYAEHPEDRENIEYGVRLRDDQSLVTLTGLYDQMRELGYDLRYSRMPIVDEKAPRDADFDALLDLLRLLDADCATVFNCQMGKGRTTTGMIVACLVRDIVHGQDGGKKYACNEVQIKESDFGDEEEYQDELARLGRFNVCENLFKYIPAAREAKAHLDNVIDLCGTPPKGTGLQNLRECIVWTKQKFDFEPKKKKPFWQRMSVNFIERYCYLICFATYLKEEAPKGFEKTFTLWMDIRAELREIIFQGMKNFEWK